MKKDNSFVRYVVEDLFGYLGGTVSARAMFGGCGVYRDGVMFALIEDGELYFKVDESQKETYLALGGKPFTYMKEGKPQELSYFYVPEEAQENNDLFRRLAEQAYELALQKAVKKTPKKKVSKK
jgi:DNA transformation protein